METATGTIGEVLAQMAPGLELAVLLAGVDLACVSDDEVVEVLAARDRQGAHERARFLGAVLETALRSSAAWGCGPGEFGRYCADEVRAALMLTPGGADMLVEHAWEIFVRLPRLGEGMLAGELDESRARKFTRLTCGVPDDLARKVCEKLVARASGWTTSQLGERIKRELLALDPDWARKRYEAALEARDVVGYRDSDGTATLTGRHLPVDRVAAVADRLDRLAKSAKTAGDPRRIGHLRAELYLGMTDGTYSRFSDAEIVAHLLANRPDLDLDDDGLDDDGLDDDGLDDDGLDDDKPGPDDLGGDDPGPDEPGPDEPGPDEPDGPGPSGAGATDSDPEDPGPAEPDEDPAWPDDDHDPGPERDDTAGPGDLEPAAVDDSGGRVPVPGPARGGIELQVRLSTLLGSDEAPAELAGWGPVHAALARTIAARLTDAEWRWAVTTPDGYLSAGGITAVRPAGTVMGRRTDDVLEIAIPATLLDQLTELTDHQSDEKLAAWIPVLADIRRRMDFRPDRPPPDPDRRFPDAAPRREIQMALRRCMGVGCRRPARKADLDHTLDHAHGGPTIGENLGPACGRDHALKHQGGWGLERTGPHTFTWTSLLGRRYVVHTPPVIAAYPAPEPCGAEPTPPWFNADYPWQLTTTWDTPEGPEGPEPNPNPDPEPEPEPAYLDVPPF